MNRMAVIDFETTGMSPDHGDRPTEVAVVLLEGGRIVDRYQSLMDAGVPVPPFITGLTGISNAMVAGAPSAARVMREAHRFVGRAPMAAHNASFDQRFWQAEIARLGEAPAAPFVCTMLLARRLYPQAPNHKLGTLAQWHGLPATGAAHRALADAEMAARLLLRIHEDLRQREALDEIDPVRLLELQRRPRSAPPQRLAQGMRSRAGT